MFYQKPHIARECKVWVLYSNKGKTREICSRLHFWAICIEAVCYAKDRKMILYTERTGVHHQGD